MYNMYYNALKFTNAFRLMKLQGLRDARPSEDDKAKVTLEQLQAWAEEEMGPDEIHEVKGFVALVASFGQPGRPLLLRGDAAKMLH